MNREWENVIAVQKMQDYIKEHDKEEITLYELAQSCGYSPGYATKIFNQYVGKTPFEYIRALRLSEAALRIRDEQTKILDIALDFQFDSHEGFTRAFNKEFGISPKRYQKKKVAIPLYKSSPVKEGYVTMKKIEMGALEETRKLRLDYIKYLMEFPKRKLIIKRDIKATNYFEFEQEQIERCQYVWGVLCSIKDALNEPMGIWLSGKYRREGTSIYVQGVEVPYDYNSDIPEGFECIELPSQLMMIFQSQPYEDEYFMEEVLDLQNYIMQYNPSEEGYVWDEDGYRLQLEPQGKRGYIEGRAVKIRKKE